MATEVMTAPEGRIIHKTYAVLSGAAMPQRVHVTQYDESLPVIACTLYKDGQLYTIPDGASVRLRMNKNGLPVYHEAMGIDDARHVVYLEITAQMTVLYGEFAMVIEVETSDGKTAGTSYLRLIVRQNPVQNPDLDNIPDYTANSNRLTAEGVKKLQDESSTQQKAIEDKGKNTLESIPADYSALSGKVDKNTSGISELKEDIGNRNITLNFNYDGFINENGELDTSVTSFKTTDFIAVTESVIAVGQFGQLGKKFHYIHCYNSNKNYLGGIIQGIEDNYKIVNVNDTFALIEGTCFIRVTNHITSLDKIKMKYSLSDTGDLSSINQDLSSINQDLSSINQDLSSINQNIGNRNITLNFNYDGFINENGELDTSITSFKTTDFIAVTESVIAVGQFGQLGKKFHYIHCYNSNKNYLGGIIQGIEDNYKIVNVNDTFALIEGTCFIRVTNHITSLDKIKMKYSLSDTGDLSSINQDLSSINQDLSSINQDLSSINQNLSSVNQNIGNRNITLNFNYDGFINENGELDTSITSFKTTDFIDASEKIIAKGELWGLDSRHHYINCYDANKEYIGGVVSGRNDNDRKVEINKTIILLESTCFIKVTTANTLTNLISLKYYLIDTQAESKIIQQINKLQDKYNNYFNINDGLGFSAFSKFASVGDSLSVGYHTEKDGTAISKDLNHSWGAYIEKRCGTKSFWTGSSGQTCKTWLNTTSDTWGLNYCKSIGSMPLYVICMGANESNINIGTTEDIDTDNDTLYAYVSKVINELRKISPKSYIVCTGVSRKQNSIGINNVYKTICELKEKCYYLDCFKEFNSEPFTSYYFNFHYSANGYSLMANLFDYKLKEIMAKNVEDFKYINEAEK